eukprot:c1382_g1_i1 orf=746-2461(+)
MSPWQRKLRRALGSVKDQTTIGLAKVVGAMAPELEVALVKVTSHDKAPFEEKHVQEVIFLISTSRAYSMACVSHVSRRLSRTQNWIVAVKVLMLIHRLLREGDPAFEEELLRESRAGSHVLNLSGFRDDSITVGWEYSAFVRTYALFLDELLDYNASVHAFSTDARRASSSSNSSFGRRSGSDTYGSMNEEHGAGCFTLAFKDMKPNELVERISLVQRMLERVLACHPAGAAKMDRLVQIALELVVKDSFQFYGSICDGLGVITDAFFEMEDTDCTKAFEIQTVAAKQAEALNNFYILSKSIGMCPSLEYPLVQTIPEEHLETMEGFLRDRFIRASADKQEKGSKELQKPKALHASPLPQAISAATQVLNVREQPTKLSLVDTAVSAEDHGQSFALAPFAATDAFAWKAFEKGEASHAASGELVEESSVNGWELALLASTNQTTGASSYVMAGGFDGLLVDRLHEQATYNQRLALSVPRGIVGSLIPPGNPSSLLALPAPETPPGEDPFAASSSIPPPSYVQMSDMKQKQELLVQEQQLWDRYQIGGMQGQIYDRGMNRALQSFLSTSLLH